MPPSLGKPLQFRLFSKLSRFFYHIFRNPERNFHFPIAGLLSNGPNSSAGGNHKVHCLLAEEIGNDVEGAC
jgi:hypothetical protein